MAACESRNTGLRGVGQLEPEVATVTPKGRVIPKGNGTATIVAREGSVEAKTTVKVEPMDKPAPVSFRQRRDPRVQPGRLQHGRLPRHADRQGGLPAQPARLPARPGYIDPYPRGRRPPDQPAGRRDQPDPQQAARRDPPRRRPAAGPRTRRAYEYLRDWIKEGAKDDPGALRRVRLEILPGSRVLNAPAKTQQVVGPSFTTPTAPSATSRRSATTTRRTPRSPRSMPTVTSRSRSAARSRSSRITSNLVANVRLTHLVEVPGFGVAEVPQDNVIDRAVFAKLNRMRISPSEICTDPEFIRRVYLDALGVLPTPEEVKAFLADPPPDRARQAGRPAARPARVLRLLDAQVRRHPPGQRPADPDQGDVRLPSLDSDVTWSGTRPDGPVRPRAC